MRSRLRKTKTSRSDAAAAGFTLIELVLVVALLIVVAAVLVPTMGVTVETRELRKDSGAALGLLRQARVIAAVQGTRARVVFDPGEIRLEKLEDPSTSLDTYVAVDGPSGRPFELEEDVTVLVTHRETEETLTEIVFYPDGRADPADVELTHADLEEVWRVSVDELTGIARLERVGEEE